MSISFKHGFRSLCSSCIPEDVACYPSIMSRRMVRLSQGDVMIMIASENIELTSHGKSRKRYCDMTEELSR